MKTATIDIGGTFTDCLIMNEAGEVREFKVLSTPPNYDIGLLASLAKAAESYGQSVAEFLADLETIVHGTTVASNALMTGTGAKTGMLTTKGFRDIYEMRRGVRLTSMYNLFVPPYEPLVPRYLRIGIEERTEYTGKVLTGLSENDVLSAMDYFRSEGVESVAICYLHSYVNPDHELRTQAIANATYPDVYTITSHEILPVWREFERFSTTVVAAYVGPVVDRYLSTLETRLKEAGFKGTVLIMLNSGLVQTVEKCRRNAVRVLGSGPAAAPYAALHWGRRAGSDNVISLDIGGTTTEVALITDGEIPTSNAAWIGDEHVAVKQVDAPVLQGGGGNVAWIDSLGTLRLGPRSAGASPGPACYNRGGTEATVTDAFLLLGYIDPFYFLGGEIKLVPELAAKAVGAIGKRLGMGVTETAEAIFSLATTMVAGHITSECTKRGLDPRDYILVAGGGGGPMHAAWVADRLDIGKVIVPPFSALLSAFGMFSMDIGREYARSYVTTASKIDLGAVNRLYEDMEKEAFDALSWLRVRKKDVTLARSAAMRYVGQFHELDSTLPNGRLNQRKIEASIAGFHKRHERVFAFAMPEQEVEFLTFGLRASIAPTPANLIKRKTGKSDPSAALKGRRNAIFAGKAVKTAIYDGDLLKGGNIITGPSIIEQGTRTIMVPDKFRCKVDDVGAFYVDKGGRNETRAR
ncbi:MAG: hydantoinase/oxoprolinase family protein [Hyphomicrobiales bacterium]|nr:hydantoinase/oxoprolinase family protein [Hyphomicrobiales bacterium]